MRVNPRNPTTAKSPEAEEAFVFKTVIFNGSAAVLRKMTIICSFDT